jgi:hypothetical protein
MPLQVINCDLIIFNLVSSWKSYHFRISSTDACRSKHGTAACFNHHGSLPMPSSSALDVPLPFGRRKISRSSSKDRLINPISSANSQTHQTPAVRDAFQATQAIYTVARKNSFSRSSFDSTARPACKSRNAVQCHHEDEEHKGAQ